MTLDEYIYIERCKLVAFVQFWEKMNKHFPDEYPMNLDDDQWPDEVDIFKDQL